MLAKVLVLAVIVAAVSCENRLYRLKTVVHRQAPKEYRHHPHEQIREIPIREYQEAQVSREQYKLPESNGQAYASHSIIHQGQSAAYEESQETNTEHVAPVYQYVDEQNEIQNAHHGVPVNHKYYTLQYPVTAPVQHDIQNIQIPNNKVPQYQPEIHEVPSYHHQVPHDAPQYAPHHEVPTHHSESHDSHEEPIDYYAYPKYQYEYKVEDPHTGDNKFQHEIRDGDVVKGIYGLHEPDGSVRTVEYSSDKHHGFSAIVKHSAPGQHVQIETHHKN